MTNQPATLAERMAAVMCAYCAAGNPVCISAGKRVHDLGSLGVDCTYNSQCLALARQEAVRIVGELIDTGNPETMKRITPDEIIAALERGLR